MSLKQDGRLEEWEIGKVSKVIFRLITDKSRVKAQEAEVITNTKSEEDHAHLK